MEANGQESSERQHTRSLNATSYQLVFSHACRNPGTCQSAATIGCPVDAFQEDSYALLAACGSPLSVRLMRRASSGSEDQSRGSGTMQAVTFQAGRPVPFALRVLVVPASRRDAYAALQFPEQPRLMNTSGQLLLVGPGVYSDGSGIRLIPLQQDGCALMDTFGVTECSEPLALVVHLVKPSPSGVLDVFRLQPLVSRAFQVFSRPALEHAAGRSYSYGHSHSTQAGVKNEPDWGSPGAGGTSACQPFSPNGVYSRTGSLDRTSSERNSARSSGSVRVRTLPPKARRSSNSSGPRRSRHSLASGSMDAATYGMSSLQGLQHLYGNHSNTNSPRASMPLSAPLALMRSQSHSGHAAALAARLQQEQQQRRLLRHGSMPLPAGSYQQAFYSQPMFKCETMEEEGMDADLMDLANLLLKPQRMPAAFTTSPQGYLHDDSMADAEPHGMYTDGPQATYDSAHMTNAQDACQYASHTRVDAQGPETGVNHQQQQQLPAMCTGSGSLPPAAVPSAGQLQCHGPVVTHMMQMAAQQQQTQASGHSNHGSMPMGQGPFGLLGAVGACVQAQSAPACHSATSSPIAALTGHVPAAGFKQQQPGPMCHAGHTPEHSPLSAQNARSPLYVNASQAGSHAAQLMEPRVGTQPGQFAQPHLPSAQGRRVSAVEFPSDMAMHDFGMSLDQ